MFDELAIYDFDKAEKVNRFYGGASGNKMAIRIDDDLYIVKYPQNLKQMEMQFPVSYSNNAVTEYIGSHFYKYVGIPVHETYLGTSKGKLVVACKDFCSGGKLLFEFNKCVNSYFPVVLESVSTPDSSSSSNSTDLKHCIDVIDNLEAFSPIRDQVRKRFWDMFVVDAVIANPDRNCGNWGVLIDSGNHDSIELAPVYDNGNSLNCKWSDEKMSFILHLGYKEQIAELRRTSSVFTESKDEKELRINPFRFMEQSDNKNLQDAIIRLMPRLKEGAKSIGILIDSLPVISEMQKVFYKKSINSRIDDILFPIFKKITGGCSDDCGL